MLKNGDRINNPGPCERCHHGNCGTVIDVGNRDHPEYGGPVVEWDPPPSDCACSCHTPWRILNHVPVVVEAAA